MHFSNVDALDCNLIQDRGIKDKTFWDSGVKVDRSQFLFYFVPLESEAQAQLGLKFTISEISYTDYMQSFVSPNLGFLGFKSSRKQFQMNFALPAADVVASWLLLLHEIL